MIKSERPVILTSNEVTMTEGQTAIADMSRLQPIMDAPVWVDRINFMVRGISQNVNYLVNMGGDIACRIQVGRHFLSSDFIPVWSYCQQTIQANNQNSVGGGSQASANNTSHKKWTWKLPKPLFVPRGAPIVPLWTWIPPPPSVAGGGTAAAQISMVGRVAADPTAPDEVDIPWVARWVGELKASAGAAGLATRSGENDLYNATSKAVHVQRLIGRIRRIRHGGTRIWEDEFADATRSIQARVYNWNGEALTGDFFRWSSIFEPSRCTWNLNYDVPSTKSLFIETQPFTSIYTIGAMTAYVSMIGTRKETL